MTDLEMRQSLFEELSSPRCIRVTEGFLICKYLEANNN